MTGNGKAAGMASWRQLVARYEKPSLKRGIWQILNTHIPYFGLLVLMYLSLDVSYWITLALAIPAAGFLMRNFIIFHDCGHQSFFKSRKANRIVGFFTALITYMPSYYWTHEHSVHHATSGNLDHRGSGDIWTLTVQEYLALPRWQRLGYRLYRNPIVMFGVAPLYLFLVHYRYWRPGDKPRARWSTLRTNLALLAVVAVAWVTIGIKAFAMIQLPILLVSGSTGIWMFYVQHQFENTYWARDDKWNYVKQALEGSSFYKLPRVLQWFSGNIGFHHIHHLSPRIPNYNLERCHKSSPVFSAVPCVTLWSGMKALTYRLWDEDRKKLVGFSYVREYLQKQATSASA